ncbi:MAG: amino acid adenylation domain-containing protein, partial [Deltaproteobacteria bacterium]|nr:amino acid adenylation domain-containing protein [Deltaproteobacteria bacterium]
ISDDFAPGLVDSMFDTLRSLVLALARDDGAWTRTGLPELPDEQRRLRIQLNDTATSYSPRRLEALFAQRVAENPGHPAVIDARGTMSYAEVSEASSAVAARLVSHGLPPGSFVGLALPSGRAQLAAVFGCLMAGCAYVPVSPHDPRTPELLRRTDCRVVLVCSSTPLPSLPPEVHPLTLELDSLPRSTRPPLPSLDDAGAPAYVLFTSGSTGTPKGVPISHHSVVNRMVDVAERFGLTPSDRVFAITALEHDLSIFDIFGMLSVVGGTVVLCESADRMRPDRWIDQIRRHEVTVWNSVPAFVGMLLETASCAASSLPSLRLALLSGDWVPRTMPARLSKVAPEARFIALGGPTETTVWDICYPVDALPDGWSSIPYGRPMANARYYVLDDELRECPDWVTGELYIGGTGLMLGYVGDPEAIEGCFVQHPSLGERLYRSGDRGRIREGLIEFRGRVDGQVKIRGRRIELGEIEHVVEQHPKVERAIAVVLDKGTELARLAVAVTTAAEQGVASDGDLRTSVALRASVPILAGAGRRSVRAFAPQPVPFEAFATLLYALSDSDRPDVARRRHPSAGGCYPLRLFVDVADSRVQGLSGGSYVLDPVERALIKLEAEPVVPSSAHVEWNRDLAASAAFSIFIVADRSAIEPRYGTWWRDLCLVESGYVGQLAMCVAKEVGIGLCPIGGLARDDWSSVPWFEAHHEFVHCMVGGAPRPIDGHTSDAPAPARPEARAAGHLGVEALRALVRRRLPPFMRPSEYLIVDALPLTRNGKPDRSAIETAFGHRMDVTTEVRGATGRRSTVEADIVTLLRTILDRAEIPLDVPFQEFGVASIHVVELTNGLVRVGYALHVTDVFGHPTVTALARHLLSHGEPEAEATLESRAEHRRRMIRRRKERNDGR